jgi:hypothetical protein
MYNRFSWAFKVIYILQVLKEVQNTNPSTHVNGGDKNIGLSFLSL